jgi:hypothetical protein
MIEENQLISVDQAEYLENYKIRLLFNDGKEQIIDFENFIVASRNPHINKYRDLTLFKQFKITDGDLEWNDYDLCFPIADLYENKNIGDNSAGGSGEAA